MLVLSDASQRNIVSDGGEQLLPGGRLGFRHATVAARLRSCEPANG